MYFISKICVLCLNTNHVTQILENNIYKQILFALPELNFVAAENNSYVCTTCQSNIKNFCIFKKLCIENYYRWKSYKNLLLSKNGVPNETYSNMQVRLEKTVNNDRNIEDSNAELNYSLHTELDIKPSQTTCEFYENADDFNNIDFDIPEIIDHHIKVNNSQSQQIPQNVQAVNNNLINDSVQNINISYTETEEIQQTVEVVNIDRNENKSNCKTQKFKCTHCKKILRTKKRLKEHMFEHTGVKEFPCSICQKVFKLKRYVRDHMRSHDEKKLECEKCHKKFGYTQSLKRHLKSCSKRLNKKRDSTDKKKPKQKKTINKEPQKKQNNSFSMSLTSLQDLPSKIKMILQHSNSVRRKFNRILQDKLTAEEKNEVLENLIKPAAINIKNYSCLFCKKQMTSGKLLRKHVTIHNEVKDLKCKQCSKVFVQRRSLYRHMKIHLNDRPYKCPLCSKDFIETHDLIRHGKFHLGIKNHECAICKKKFTEKQTLQVHMKIHRNKNITL